MTYLAPTDSELTLACWASNAVGRQDIPCLIHIIPASKLSKRDHLVLRKLYLLPYVPIATQRVHSDRSEINFSNGQRHRFTILLSRWFAHYMLYDIYLL